MRSFLVVILLATLPGLGVGCGGDKTTSPSPPNFQVRLDAALAISDPSAKDRALTTLAKDATEAGEAEIVKKAVDKISDPQTKDMAADRAALKLSSMGKAADAVEVAKMINDQSLRDGLLSKLSK
jgi:hypothetical protein